MFWGRQGAGEYGPTDLIALQALTLLDDMRCGCGCQGWSDECLNADLQDVWEPRVGTHWRQVALAKGREHYEQELKEPGAFLYLHDPRTEDA